MCTLSWLAQPEQGYTLWFNRDELHSRSPERPPVEHTTSAGMRWMAPIDPVSGGTWLMVNAAGLTVALLNDYVSTWAGPLSGSRESRGRLIPLVADSRAATDAVESLAAENLGRTPPFELVAADAQGDVAQLHWDGVEARLTYGVGVRFPRSSSSYRAAEVIASRRAGHPVPATVGTLDEFHRTHDAESGAFAVNMCRPDASTRSICVVGVSAQQVTLDYDPQNWPGAPVGNTARSTHQLLRST
jgi:hypothetical protein